MIIMFLVLFGTFALPETVDELPLAPRPITLEPTFEQMIVELRAELEEKKHEFSNAEETYGFVREYTDPIVEQLGPSGFLVQSHIYVYKEMESGVEWANAVLPLIFVERIYKNRIHYTSDLELSVVASHMTASDENFRRYYNSELFGGVIDDAFLKSTEKLLRAKWSEGEHSCNGLLDYVYAVDAFEGWSLWHKLIGTSEDERSALLERLEVLALPYNGGFKTEERWASQYERQGKDYRPELEAGLEILREFVSEGGLPEKVFVAEILERAPVFRADHIVGKLQEEEHPFVKVRLRYLDEDE